MEKVINYPEFVLAVVNTKNDVVFLKTPFCVSCAEQKPQVGLLRWFPSTREEARHYQKTYGSKILNVQCQANCGNF